MENFYFVSVQAQRNYKITKKKKKKSPRNRIKFTKLNQDYYPLNTTKYWNLLLTMIISKFSHLWRLRATKLWNDCWGLWLLLLGIVGATKFSHFWGCLGWLWYWLGSESRVCDRGNWTWWWEISSTMVVWFLGIHGSPQRRGQIKGYWLMFAVLKLNKSSKF